MEKKALFFDVDGTLLSEQTKKVPASAVKALREAREMGHLVFINSGRVYSQLGQIMELLEADGYLCGCGTYVRVGEEVLYSYKIPHEAGIEIKKVVDSFGAYAVLEAEQGCYMQDLPDPSQEVARFRHTLKKSGILMDQPWENHNYQFDKLCVMLAREEDKEEFISKMERHLDVIDRGRNFYECVPKGHSKATAIAVVLERFGIDLDHAYVFGDSMNDLSMFRFARNAILMGEHDKGLEEFATFTTKKVEEDGIEFAMRELGILLTP